MNIFVFSTLFYAIFLTSIAVGPVFITISNISINYGTRNGLFAVIGVIIANILYMFVGALFAMKVINTLPDGLIQIVSFIASLFLLYIAFCFFKKEIKDNNNDNFFKIKFTTIIKMFFITLSSPVVIAGYSVTFLSVSDMVKDNFFSAFFGGVSASIVAYSSIAIVFGLLGKKISKMNFSTKNKILLILNKIAGSLLLTFAVILIFNFLRKFF